MEWTTLPKVELHLHLDWSLSYAVVSQIDPSITPERYSKDFIARENGISYTTHAGETRGLLNVWDKLKHFAPSRLSHGVPCLDNPELVA